MPKRRSNHWFLGVLTVVVCMTVTIVAVYSIVSKVSPAFTPPPRATVSASTQRPSMALFQYDGDPIPLSSVSMDPSPVEKRVAEFLAALDERVLSKYEEESVSWEDYSNLYSLGDFDGTEKMLDKQFRKISDPWEALAYSDLIDHMSATMDDMTPLLAMAERWTTERPRSHHAWLVRGALLRKHAWKCRGGGFADTVTEEGWQQFYSALLAARDCLERSYALNPRDPESSFQMLWVCIGLDAPQDVFETYFRRVTRIVPNHWDAYLAKMQFLSPKWGGSWPAVDALIREIDKVAQEQRIPILPTVKLYTYDEMQRYREGYEKAFQQNDIADATLAAIDHWLEARPQDTYMRANRAAVLCWAHRYADANEEFETLGDRYYGSSIWRHKQQYSSWRGYCYLRTFGGDGYNTPEKVVAEAMERGLRDSDPLYFLAVNESADRRIDEAEFHLIAAIQRDQDNGTAWTTLSSIYQSEKRYPELLRVAVQAQQHELDPRQRQMMQDIVARLTGTENDPAAGAR